MYDDTAPSTQPHLPETVLASSSYCTTSSTNGALTYVFSTQNILSGEPFLPFYFWSKSGCIQMDFLKLIFSSLFLKLPEISRYI